jgi:anaerobic selenocysteine-containing dehydrogenase
MGWTRSRGSSRPSRARAATGSSWRAIRSRCWPGRGAHHFLNSSYANVGRALKAERIPLLDVHPDDALPRGIAEGELVRVFNGRGSVELPARIGDKVRPGVVSMPSGWWASLSPSGSSANALTPDGLSDLGGGASFHDALVQVERVRSA